jgi:hypothetical protein
MHFGERKLFGVGKLLYPEEAVDVGWLIFLFLFISFFLRIIFFDLLFLILLLSLLAA